MEQNPVDDRIGKAYSEFMTKLFGSVPADPRLCAVTRDTYAEAMHEVQERHGLKQGDPDFLEWVLTLVGRSPVLIEKGDIVYGRSSDEGPSDVQTSTMGETPSGETDGQ